MYDLRPDQFSYVIQAFEDLWQLPNKILLEKNKELERLNKLFIDREFRIKK